MASTDNKAIKRLRCLSQCCICLTTYCDPRLLPCFHTACLKCFEDMQSRNRKKPGDVLPCPLCRKEFSIPPEGMTGLQKNFFIENLMEVTEAFNCENRSISCVMCSMNEEVSNVTEATIRCLDCFEDYCYRCSQIHRGQKLTKDHKIVELKSICNEEEIRNMFPIRKCKRHRDRGLDYYCSDCKTVVCVSCFVESHKFHDCKDVTTVDEEFRQKLEESSTELHDYRDQILSKKVDMETKKKEFLTKVLETENAIRRQSQELKALIDQHTQIILNEFYLLKQKQKKKMEEKSEEIERKLTILESFVTYCTELKSKGSPSEVCDSADNLIARAKELSKECEQCLTTPSKSFGIEFIATNQRIFLDNVGNAVGKVSESTNELTCCAIVIGDSNVSRDVFKINLNQPEDVTNLQPVPTKMQRGAAAAVYCNSIFVTGIGNKSNEIWKMDSIFLNWEKCASLAQSRKFHSVAFVAHNLYICGGNLDSYDTTFGVETYNSNDNKCTRVGKLCYAVHSAGNCVSFKNSLYIFGGFDANDDAISNVQVFDTKSNTCTLLSNPIPRACSELRGALWENTVILLGHDGCFVYNFETEVWEERDDFKLDVISFGMVVDGCKIFVIGGADPKSGFKKDDVRCIPVANIISNKSVMWRQHAKLPKPSSLYAFEKLDVCVT